MVHSSPFPLDLAIAFHLWSQIQSEDAILETLKIKQWYFTPENKVLNHTNVDFCKILPSSTSNAGVICKGMGSISCECVSPKVTS